MSEPLLVSVRDAATLLGVGRDATYRLIHEGQIRTIRIGRKILVPRSELVEFCERTAERQQEAS